MVNMNIAKTDRYSHLSPKQRKYAYDFIKDYIETENNNIYEAAREFKTQHLFSEFIDFRYMSDLAFSNLYNTFKPSKKQSRTATGDNVVNKKNLRNILKKELGELGPDYLHAIYQQLIKNESSLCCLHEEFIKNEINSFFSKSL